MRAARARSVGSPSGRPARCSVHGPRTDSSRSRTPAASRAAVASSRASSPSGGITSGVGAMPSPSSVTVVVRPQRRSVRKATPSGRPWRCDSTTPATGRVRGRRAAPSLRTAVSQGPRAVAGTRSSVIRGAAAATSRTTRARPIATRVNTPESHHSRRRDRRRLWSCAHRGAVGLSSDGAAAQAAALTLGEAAPDAEPLVVGERVLEALGLHLAPGADLLRLTGRAALLGEERLRVGLGAEGLLLPGLRVGLEADAHQPGDPLPGEPEGVSALAGTGAEAVGGPVVRTHVVAQPGNLGHDDASPLALVPVRGGREAPVPLSTR